jgi:tRNA-specific 2-thiouridylase
MRVAAHLGIPFRTLNFESEYAREVFAYMRDGYARGITPNPDVRCNETIKFGVFYAAARRSGAEYIATGHYARIRRTRDGHTLLLKGTDQNKDQSYFLHRVRRVELERTLFPVGRLTKAAVRRIARGFGLPNAERRSTRGICFVGKMPLRQVLERHLAPAPATIVTTHGALLGTTPDMIPFTIGQRHGLGIGGGAPYFVVKKDIARRILTVAHAEDAALATSAFNIENAHWIQGGCERSISR